MSQDCCASEPQIMILACSGASNIGQLSNQAAVELAREGFGKMFCLAGIGAHLSGFIQSAKDVPNMVAIDGCGTACAKKILEHAEIPVKAYVAISDLGIEKTMDTVLNRDQVELVKNAVRGACNGLGIGAAVPQVSDCGCGAPSGPRAGIGL
jgi:uncharacterized metal-binding protein